MSLPSIFADARQRSAATAAIKFPALSAELLVEPFPAPPTRHASKKVVSGSFFIFPGRAVSSQYIKMVRTYLDGLERGVCSIDAFPDWEYRLYVDHSVYASHDGNPIAQEAATMAQERLAALRASPQRHRLVLYGTRFTDARWDASFLPSIWRFLPMADASVDVFTVVDVENPVNGLVMSFGDAWLRGGSTKSMFVAFPHYFPPQCLVYLQRFGYPSEHEFCPVAQFWFWRPSPGDKRAFVAMVELIADPDLTVFLGVDPDWLFGEVRESIVGSEAYAELLASQRGSVPLGTMRAIVKAALEALASPPPPSRRASGPGVGEVLGGTRSLSRRRGRAPAASEWLRTVLRSDKLLDMLVMALVGNALGDRKSSASSGSRVPFLHGREQFEAAARAVTRAGYGVDEFVLNALVSTRDSTVITPDSPEAGVSVQPVFINTHTGPTTVQMLASAGRGACDGRDKLDYVIRAAILTMVLRPQPSSSPESFAWHRRVTEPYKRRVAYLNHEADAVGLLIEKEYEFLRAMMFRVLAFDSSKLASWCAARDIVCRGNGRFVYRTRRVEQMDELKDVFVRALCITFWTLFLPGCIDTDRIKEFTQIPW